MDETPVFFNLSPSKTIAHKGQKTILIKTQDNEKCRLTFLLTITVDGGKLPYFTHYMIFKAKKRNRRVEKDSHKDINLLQKKCFVACNNNTWSTIDIIKDWDKKVFKS